MHEFELIVLLLFGAVVVAAVARRVGAPYPAFLALGGALLALIPGAPHLTLRPDLALALFVAPVLLDAAYDASPRDLKDNWAALASLVIVAVALTTLAVAFVVRTLEPAMPWAAAIALGAIVAPPDAAAATAVLRQVRPPHRIVTILEGESLLNDATALLIYRVAVGAVLAGGFSVSDLGPMFLLAIAGSLVVGYGFAWVYLRVLARVRDIPSAIILQFVATFAIWIFAEHVGLSAVLTTVCYAITLARSAPELTPARLRIPAYAVWETAVFVLNVLAFVVIGLQLRPVLDALEPHARVRYFYVAGAVLATVIVVRFGWVMLHNAISRLKVHAFGHHPPRPMPPPTASGGLVIAWCGMRGVVSLAAALALPPMADGKPFPFRDLIVLTAFSVVLGTLIIQGLTLKPLLRLLDLRDDDPVGREVELARNRALRAALSSVEGDTSPAAQAVRHEYIAFLRREAGEEDDATPLSVAHNDIRRRALGAARHAVSEMRSSAEIGDDAFHQIEEDLDRIELSTSAR